MTTISHHLAEIKKQNKNEFLLQVIITSNTWHRIMRPIFQKRDNILICIAAYIEAAIYANVEITVHSTNDSDRYRQLLACLYERSYTNERTIIVCSKSEDVIEIYAIFRAEAIAVTVCHDVTKTKELGECRTVSIVCCLNELNFYRWNKKTDYRPTTRVHRRCAGILKCQKRSAHHTLFLAVGVVEIHATIYSFVRLLRKFCAGCERHHDVISVCFAWPMIFNFQGKSTGRPTSVVFVDAESYDTMPRLIDFMKMRCSANVPEHVLAMAEVRHQSYDRLTSIDNRSISRRKNASRNWRTAQKNTIRCVRTYCCWVYAGTNIRALPDTLSPNSIVPMKAYRATAI